MLNLRFIDPIIPTIIATLLTVISGLVYLSAFAAPKKRFGEVLYSRSALYVIFEKILIAVIIPLGFVMVFVRPKETWPAIVWVGGGILATLSGYSLLVWETK